MTDLNIIFEEQEKFNDRIIPGFLEQFKDKDKMREWFLKFLLAMQQEQAEAVDSLNWKWWKRGEDDLENLKIELVDMFHFWVSMCQIVGMSAEDVFNLYMKKNKLNHNRQDNGYKDGSYDKFKDGVEDNKRII